MVVLLLRVGALGMVRVLLSRRSVVFMVPVPVLARGGWCCHGSGCAFRNWSWWWCCCVSVLLAWRWAAVLLAWLVFVSLVL